MNMAVVNNPRLFGINNSNRNFTNPDTWGKNQFNSSFPASLVAYMYHKEIPLVYLKTDENNKVIHSLITGKQLFGISPLDNDAFYSFESVYSQYQPFYIGNAPRIDLVIQSKQTGLCLKGLEIKLTALPDNSTCDLSEDEFSCEIVIRPDTISYLACSVATEYPTIADRAILKSILGDFSDIHDWEDPAEVIPQFDKCIKAVKRLIIANKDKQTPLILQPIWKTKGKAPILDDHCLDTFVWSNMAAIHLFTSFDINGIRRIGRTERTLIWLIKMLLDYADNGQFDAEGIIDKLSYNTKNDKAFSVNGRITYPLLKCNELKSPRVLKSDIKNIILGGGQNLLSPERRFDAIIFNSPDLFV